MSQTKPAPNAHWAKDPRFRNLSDKERADRYHAKRKATLRQQQREIKAKLPQRFLPEAERVPTQLSLF